MSLPPFKKFSNAAASLEWPEIVGLKGVSSNNSPRRSFRFAQACPPLDAIAIRIISVTAKIGGEAEYVVGDVGDVGENNEFKEAVNYCNPSGLPGMKRWAKSHIKAFHAPKYDDWGVSMTTGSSAAIADLLRILTNPGDYILMEQYTFITTMQFAKAQGLAIISLEMDQEGIQPELMEKTLQNLGPRLKEQNGGRTLILYTIPTTQNPTGVTQGEGRRRRILNICRTYGVGIIEDDPSYWIQADIANVRCGGGLPSYCSLDDEGRVIRLDSFSKTISPGLRLGFLTANQQIIDMFDLMIKMSHQNPSSIIQYAIYRLFASADPHSEKRCWLNHVTLLSAIYTKKREFFLECCNRFLPLDLVRWEDPKGGLFIWLKINHSMTEQNCIAARLETAFDSRGIQVIFGCHFFSGTKGDDSTAMHVRIAYASDATEIEFAPVATNDDHSETPLLANVGDMKIEEGVRMIGAAIRQAFLIT